MHLHYDLIVIGSGPAGKRAAIQAGCSQQKALLPVRSRRLKFYPAILRQILEHLQIKSQFCRHFFDPQ